MALEKPAFYGGNKTVTSSFPWPVTGEEEVQAVARVVRSGQWGSPDCTGEVEAFERAFAAYCGSKYAVTCVNGSVSLRLALIACGLKPGDEVIVPPYSFIATASVVLECNCVPVFADILPESYNLDPAAVERAITPRTRAIIPVHFGGLACEMEALLALADTYNLKVIEDAAHAHGATYKGKKLGTLGHVGSFSFQSSKNLTSGEGGAVVTNDETLYHTIRSLRNVGRSEEGQWYDHFRAGCNYRITRIQAVMLSEQLKRLDAQTRTRDANGRYLGKLLEGIAGITPLEVAKEATLNCYHLFIFKYDTEQFGGLSRNDFVEQLVAEGVPGFRGYPSPLYRQPVFREKNFMCYALPENVDYSDVVCPVAEKACVESVWILQHALLGSREDMENFAAAIRKIQAYAVAKTAGN